MVEVPLTQGKVALIDDEDYRLVSRFKWRCFKQPRGKEYAHTSVKRGGKNTTFRMHTLLMNPPPGMGVDHINGDGLDNRRKNLRLATQTQNVRNSRKPKRNTSGYKGVCRIKGSRKWRASIQVDKKSIHLGMFAGKEEAARAYDEAARKYFGEFARLNFP